MIMPFGIKSFFGSEPKQLSRTQRNEEQALQVEQKRRNGQPIPKASFGGDPVGGGKQYGAFSKTREGANGRQEVVLSSKAFLNTVGKAWEQTSRAATPRHYQTTTHTRAGAGPSAATASPSSRPVRFASAKQQNAAPKERVKSAVGIPSSPINYSVKIKVRHPLPKKAGQPQQFQWKYEPITITKTSGNYFLTLDGKEINLLTCTTRVFVDNKVETTKVTADKIESFLNSPLQSSLHLTTKDNTTIELNKK